MADDRRTHLARVVRHVWVDWALEQQDPPESWLQTWSELDDGQREVDARIGEAVAVDERLRCIAELDARGWNAGSAVLMEPILPSLAQISTWMRAHGWCWKDPPGPAGAMWDHFARGHRLGLPADNTDPGAVAGVVERLALAEDRPAADILAELRAVKPDG